MNSHRYPSTICRWVPHWRRFLFLAFSHIVSRVACVPSVWIHKILTMARSQMFESVSFNFFNSIFGLSTVTNDSSFGSYICFYASKKCFSCTIWNSIKESLTLTSFTFLPLNIFPCGSTEDPLLRIHAASVVLPARLHSFVDFNCASWSANFHCIVN